MLKIGWWQLLPVYWDTVFPNCMSWPGQVAHASNPSYLGDIDQEDRGSGPAWGKKFWHTPIQWLGKVAHTCHSGNSEKHKQEDQDSYPPRYSPKQKGLGVGMAHQLVECLPSKWEALSSIQKKKGERKKEKDCMIQWVVKLTTHLFHAICISIYSITNITH
jgi:hypothetical protein